MRAKSMMLLGFLCTIGCASPAALAERARATAAKPAASVAEPEPALASPSVTLAEADHAYESQLGATRGGQFEVDRQVSVLREAVLLYTQFLERAEGQPEFAPAIRKSRERIADAEATIIFLQGGGESPPAKTE
jgi:hypothetical protein